ncbi:Co-chaperone [Coemansia sp. RSA 1200]|nr:Co-chaperone [Coemansia sp. RSA 1200]
MADWRNVGNWHWKERNCLEWAKQYFKETLAEIEVSDNSGYSARVTSVDSVEGDVDLNVRKGRLIAIYDVEIKLSWLASKKENDGAEDDSLSGNITIPEVAHDTDDYIYDITATDSSSSKLPLKDFVRRRLTPEITKAFKGFTDVLKEKNGADMFIAEKDGGVNAPGVVETEPTKAPKEEKHADTSGAASAGGSSAVSVAKTKSATFATVSIDQTVELKCSADDLFAILTDPQRVSVWTRAPAEVQPKEGTTFKLFGGHIEGKMTKIKPGKLLEQTWRVASWPADHYSNVSFELEQLSSSTRLVLKQTGVPFNEENATKANWDRYYWNGIKGTFGTNRLPFTPPPYKMSASSMPNAADWATTSDILESVQYTVDSAERAANPRRNLRKRKTRRRTTNNNSYFPHANYAFWTIGTASAAAVTIAAAMYYINS